MTRSISNAVLNFKTTGKYSNTVTDGSSSTISHPALNYYKTLTSGVQASKANRAWQSKSRSINSGAQEVIDLTDFAATDIGGGVGRDGLGQTMDMEEIVMIAIAHEGLVSAAGQLEIKPSPSEGWTPIGEHTVSNKGALRGQGILIKVQLAEVGFPIETNSHRIVLRAVGGAVSYSIYIWGRSDSDDSSSSSVSSSSSSSVSSSSSISTSSSSISTSSISTSSSSISTSSASSISTSSSSQSESSSSSSSLSESSSSLSSQS